MSRKSPIACGILLILPVTVMSGGGFLRKQTALRAESFIDGPVVAALRRAGHGHAAVPMLHAHWSQIAIIRLCAGTTVGWALRASIPVATALMSGGFFPSVSAIAGVG